MYIAVLSLLLVAGTVCSTELFDTDHDKRAVSSFDTLGGIGLGKRQVSSFDSLGGLGLGKRALSSFDTLGGIGLGKRVAPVRRALSSFDTLGGIGLGKRNYLLMSEKKSQSRFNKFGDIALGKRINSFTRQYYVPYRAFLINRNREQTN